MVGRTKVAAERGALVRRALLAGCFAWLALACSSSDDEASKGASLQCNDFETAYCAKVVQCAQSTDRSDFEQTCAFSWRVYLPCDQVGYAVNVPNCLSHVEAIACSNVQPGTFPNLPAECQGIFGNQ